MNVFEMIEQQQAKLSDTEPAWMVGEQLKDICHDDETAAAIVAEDLMSEAMSLTKAAAELKKYADQNKKGRCFCITPKVAEGILRKFYGLPETGTERQEPPKKTGVIDLFSFV